MTSKRANRYPPELRERAVRTLLEQRSEYRSEYAAINSIAPKIGCSPGQEVELATLGWVDCYNNRRLPERLGHIPPAEAEKAYHASVGEKDLAA